MECKKVPELLSDYVDGELSPEQCSRIQEHMSVCRACREFVETFRESLEWTHHLEKKYPPHAVCESILRAFRESLSESEKKSGGLGDGARLREGQEN